MFMYGVNVGFDMTPVPYYAGMILLHVLNTWLIFALGGWNVIGYRVAALAAGFFAIYEGHQEAVMWVAASNEPLMVLFGLAAFVCWIQFLNDRGALWYALSLLSFVIALLSKESAVVLVPLFALPVLFDRKKLAFVIPFAALAGLSAIGVMLNRSHSFRFQDGSFSLHAPFWLIWPNSFARLFWFWGLIALIAIAVWNDKKYRPILTIGLLWAGISLIPYSFLTYSTRIPSRQTHLASIGVSLIVGLALCALYERRRSVMIAVAAIMLVHNIGYLWTKKRAQYLERAAPTEQLIALARKTNGPIYIKCFPRPPIIASAAIELMTSSRVVSTPEQAAATFCYSKP
jgi:hypothetical protein